MEPHPPRGLFSCLYSSCDGAPPESMETHAVVVDHILDLYDEAFSRLPVDDMPPDVDLVRLVADSGACVGLLDPVTNIILNTIFRLPPGSLPLSSPPRPTRSKRKKALPKHAWREVASASYGGLIVFMQSYFGCLTEGQACRYLRWAGADLNLAVVLAEHDLCAARPSPPDPASARTHAALDSAARLARQRAACFGREPDAPAVATDGLVRLAAARLPPARIEAVANVLAGGGRRLTLHEVNAIADLARFLEKPLCDANVTLLPHGGGAVVGVRRLDVDEGVVTETTTTDLGDGYTTTTTTVRRVGEHIASLRRPEDMDSMLSACLAQADAVQVQRSRGQARPCARGDACEHLQSLRSRLHAAIHGFYLEALSLLPARDGVAGRLVRAVIVGGHCYGPMGDPVANILLNSVWHDMACPLPDADRDNIQACDVLDTLSMLRTETRSLNGLAALLRAASGHQLSMHEALEHLLHTQCDLSDDLRDAKATRGDLFAAAAATAHHPQRAGLASFHASLSPEKLEKLRPLLANRVLSRDRLEQIRGVLREEPAATVEVSAAAPKLCEEAMSTVSIKRSDYAKGQSYLRGKIEQLLQEYTARHFWEPKYKLNFICGMEQSGGVREYPLCSRVNFMAAPQESERLQKNTLFFAEFTFPAGPPYSSWGRRNDEPTKPDFCCPLEHPYTGRCYYGEWSARKIVYPDTTDYLSCDITADGTTSADRMGMIVADFVYFDSERDVEFAQLVNGYYAPGFPPMHRPVLLATKEELQNVFG